MQCPSAVTVTRVGAIVSWGFKHIVPLEKTKGYNAVNLLEGYGVLSIISPREALPHDEHAQSSPPRSEMQT